MMETPINVSWGIWLRYPTASGGKDWIGYQTPRGYIAQWGKTHQINREKQVSGNLHRKISEKLKKGYNHVAEWTPVAGWVSVSQQNASQPAARVESKPEAKASCEKKNWATEINRPENPEWF